MTVETGAKWQAVISYLVEDKDRMPLSAEAIQESLLHIQQRIYESATRDNVEVNENSWEIVRLATATAEGVVPQSSDENGIWAPGTNVLRVEGVKR